MNLKKVVSAAASLGMVGMLAFSVFGRELATASVYSADVYWDVQFWGGDADDEGNMNIASVKNAEITGDGVYTASIKFSYPLEYGQYFSLGTTFKGGGSGEASAFSDYPDADIKIIGVKADGKNIKGSSAHIVTFDGYVNSYIYNPWEDDKFNFAENLEWTQGITEIEVTFEITGLDKPVTMATSEETTVTTTFTTITTEETTVTTEEATVTFLEDNGAPPVDAVTEETTVTTAPTTVTTKETTVKEEPAATTVTTAFETVTIKETTVREEPPVTTVTTTPTTVATEETTVKEESTVTAVTIEKNDETPPADASTDSADTGNADALSFSFAMAAAVVVAWLSRGKRA